MFDSRVRRVRLVAGLLLAAGGNTHAQPIDVTPAPPDSTLYATYSFYNAYKSVDLFVCGSTQQSEGCYFSTTLAPFGHVGALIEGNPKIDRQTNSVSRNIYIVDQGAGDGVKLYVYKRTDIVTPSTDTVTVTHTRTIALPLIGGARAVTYMAANQGFLFIGTNRTQFAVRVSKQDLSVTQVGGFSPPSNVSSITADNYGYVSVFFANSGFYLFDPSGNVNEDGGGSEYLLGTSNGLSTSTTESGPPINAIAH